MGGFSTHRSSGGVASATLSMRIHSVAEATPPEAGKPGTVTGTAT
jgi:hypothetical protein